jgi:phage gpG-like protein
MADLTLTIVASSRLKGHFVTSPEVRRVMRRELNSAMLLLRSAMKENISRQFTRRTGLLENIVMEPVVETGGAMEGKVGSPAPYAQIHEFGGTVNAKNVANLTIPLPAMLTGRGVSRGTARDVISSPESYGFSGTFSAQNVIFGKHDDGSYQPLFALKKSVRIPERPYARPAMEEVGPIFQDRMYNAMVTLFQGKAAA